MKKNFFILILFAIIYPLIANGQRVVNKTNYKEATLGLIYNFESYGIIGTYRHKYSNMQIYGEINGNWSNLTSRGHLINNDGHLLLVGYQLGYQLPLKPKINIPFDFNCSIGVNFGHETKTTKSEIYNVDSSNSKFIFGFLGRINIVYLISHDFGLRAGYNLNYITNTMYTKNTYNYLTFSVLKKI